MVDPIANLHNVASNLTGIERVGGSLSADDVLMRIATGPDEYGLDTGPTLGLVQELNGSALEAAHRRAGEILEARISPTKRALRLVTEAPHDPDSIVA